MGDIFGSLFRVITWGESHGPAIGAVIEGCPPLVPLNLKLSELPVGKDNKTPVFTCEEIQKELDRRRPGQSGIVTPRKESDIAYILSGVFEGKTTGTPISVLCWNSDVKPEDYEKFKDVDRPGHAGFAYRNKYGIYDYRGGGRASYRETWGRVAAGAIAKKILKAHLGVEILAYVSQVASVRSNVDPGQVSWQSIESNAVRCPDPEAAKKMEAVINKASEEGDSVGGIVCAVVRNMPAGLGEPVFDKLDADLFKALKSIHATKAVEIGEGLNVPELKGSEHNDTFASDGSGKIHPASNKAGGVLGGISTGENLILRVAFKPTATIKKSQSTVTQEGKPITLEGTGRHDPCLAPRAVPTVEAMIALVLVDHHLRHRAQCGDVIK